VFAIGGDAGVRVVQDCIQRARAANISQPISYSDTSGNWQSNQVRVLATQVDIVAGTIYTFWTNYFGACIPFGPAAVQFHFDAINTVVRAFPNNLVVMSEYGWPAGPVGNIGCSPLGPAQQQYIVGNVLYEAQQR
jgi:hypothetical protein